MSRGLLTAICALLASGDVVADRYSFELGATFDETELDGAYETTMRGLSATYHLQQVDDAGGPPALASFRSRPSRVSARDETIVVQAPTTGEQRFTDETTSFSVAGRYVFPGTGWYVGGQIERGEIDKPSSDFVSTDTDIDAAVVTFGRYIGDRFAVDLSLSNEKSTSEVQISSAICNPNLQSLLCGALVGTELEAETADIGMLFVGSGARIAYAVAARVATSDGDISPFPASIVAVPTGPVPAVILNPGANPGLISGGSVSVAPFQPVTFGRVQRYSLSGELFPTDRIGVRLSMNRLDAEPLDDETVALAATWFVRNDLAVRVAIERREQGPGFSTPDNIDGIGLTMLGRF